MSGGLIDRDPIDENAMPPSTILGKDPRPVLVLLSGGQDSTTCLFWAKREFPASPIHALTLFYGQRHQAEVGAAAEIAMMAGVATHDIVDLSSALGTPHSALTNLAMPLEGSGGYRDQEMPEGLPTSFVPGRNLVFLAVAGAYAARYRCQAVVTGVCQTDYSGYPDCRLDFVRAMASAIRASLPTELHDVEIYTPLLTMSKADTVRMMFTMSEDTSLTPWKALAKSVTCYHGRRPGCGTCPACVLRQKGFEEAGIVDPARANLLDEEVRRMVEAMAIDQLSKQVPRVLEPVEGTPVPPRGPEDAFEVAASKRAERAAAEVAAVDHPDNIIETHLFPKPEGIVSITVFGDRIEVRGEDGADFSLDEVATYLAKANLDVGSYRFDALDFRRDIHVAVPIVVETGTATIELKAEDLAELLEECSADPVSTPDPLP